jgi:hypothetical protein
MLHTHLALVVFALRAAFYRLSLRQHLLLAYISTLIAYVNACGYSAVDDRGMMNRAASAMVTLEMRSDELARFLVAAIGTSSVRRNAFFGAIFR